jgi:hypothetical protein
MDRRLSIAFVGLCIVLCATGVQVWAQTAQRIAYDLTAMYEAVNPSIVKVHSDSGTGSGFLIRADGILVTNHHVVKNSRYLAVEFADGRKVATDVVFLDPRHDLAVIKVNRTVVAGLKPLELLGAEGDASVKAGIPVVAFGSPLSQTFLMTQGIVSKVETNSLLGDFLIQPGNSGGPLVNLDGMVVGVNTFGAGRTSGAVRVHLLRDTLVDAKLAPEALAEPSPDLLPAPASARYPTELLKSKVVSEEFDVRLYRLDGGKFTITAVTPVLMAKANVQDDLKQAANRYQRRGKKIQDERYDPVDAPFYEWLRDASGSLDLVVRFEIEPDFGQTRGSMFASVLSGVAAGLNNTRPDPTRQTYEFKAEFADFRLYRDGQLVTPVTPGRAITSQSVDQYMFSFVDEAYSGVYTYLPETFMTGNEWRLEVFDAREPGRVHKAIALNESAKLIQQIRQDFAGVVK